MTYREAVEVQPLTCGNCLEPIVGKGLDVGRTEVVCDEACAVGWWNGERAERIFKLVRDSLRAV